MSADPANWTDAKLEAHARDWADLPLVSLPPVMTDDDTAAWGNVLYARGLLDDFDRAVKQFDREALMAADTTEVELFGCRWPDHAAELLTAWRQEIAA